LHGLPPSGEVQLEFAGSRQQEGEPSRADTYPTRTIHIDPAQIRTHGSSQGQVQRMVDLATAKFAQEGTDPLLIDFCLEMAVVQVAVQKMNSGLEIVPSPEKSLVGG